MEVRLFIRKPSSGRIIHEIKMGVLAAGGLPTNLLYRLTLPNGKDTRFKPYYRRKVNGELRVFAVEVPDDK